MSCSKRNWFRVAGGSEEVEECPSESNITAETCRKIGENSDGGKIQRQGGTG